MRLLPDNFQFENPHWFWALLLLPVLAFLRRAAGRQSVIQFGSLHLLSGLGRRTSSAIGRFGLFLVFLTYTLGVAALARPQKVTTEEKIEESGVEIFFALDLSLSMSIRDMFYDVEGEGRTIVNRLTVAKNVTKDFIRNRVSDRIGFVVFAGRPYLASPLTLDRAWLEETLEKQINFDVLRSRDTMGTAIGSAIATAATRLTNRDSKSKVIILVTDGANNSGKLLPVEAAKEAAKLGIRIYTVAIGTYGRHVVPELRKMGGGYGDDVRQEFDEETLKEVAKVTGGRFYHAKDSTAMANIFGEIDRLEKTKLNIRRSIKVDELYHWPLCGAVGLALLTIILHQTLLRRYP